MATPLAALARLLLRSSAAANRVVETSAAHAFGMESVLNRCIRDSSRAGEVLRSLDGRSLAVRVEGLGIELRLDAARNFLAVRVASAPAECRATACVEGTPPDLLGLLRHSGAEGFRASRVRLAGDAQTAEAFAELLRHARPDIEEALAGMMGDMAAHEIAATARRTGAWTRRAGSATVMNVSEFLQEEARQLPPRVEVDAFSCEVERLRDDVERAAQRLDRLRARRPHALRQGARRGAAEDRGQRK